MVFKVFYAKEVKHTFDMLGFPEDRAVRNKDKVLISSDISKNDLDFMVAYEPVKGLKLLIEMDMTQEEADKAIIGFLWEEEKKKYLNLQKTTKKYL